MNDYDKVISDNSVEMAMAKEWYNWKDLSQCAEHWHANDIVRLSEFLKKNKHRLVDV